VTSKSTTSVERALDILWLMYMENKEIGVTEIAQSLGCYKSTVHRNLIALQKKGFVEKNAVTGKYWLGMAIYNMGMLYGSKISLKDIWRPFAEELCAKLRETVNLGVLDKNSNELGRVVLIDKVETNQRLTLVPAVGTLSYAHASSNGKVLLSHQDDAYIERFAAEGLKKFTNNTITDLETLKSELTLVRERGYAVDKEEIEIGLMCVGAPIYDKNGIVAALSVSGPTGRFQGERFMEVVREVTRTAEKISHRLML